MTRSLPALLAAALLVSACHMADEDRREILQSAGRANYQVARGVTVRDLAAPTDSGRLIYDAPVSLSIDRARSMGNIQMWAPFGIATPDSAAAGSPRR